MQLHLLDEKIDREEVEEAVITEIQTKPFDKSDYLIILNIHKRIRLYRTDLTYQTSIFQYSIILIVYRHIMLFLNLPIHDFNSKNLSIM